MVDIIRRGAGDLWDRADLLEALDIAIFELGLDPYEEFPFRYDCATHEASRIGFTSYGVHYRNTAW